MASDSTLSDATNALIAVGNYKLQKKANEDNLDIARQNLGLSEQQMAYIKELQEKTWARDDNAITRMVNDLKANGFNPLLALGTSGFNNSNVSMPSAPQLDYKEIAPQFNARVHSNLGMIEDLENLELLRKSKDLMDAKIAGQTVSNVISETKAIEDAYNYEYYKKRGLPTNASTLQKDLSTLFKDSEALNLVQDSVKEGVDRINEVNEALKNVQKKSEKTVNKIQSKQATKKVMKDSQNNHAGGFHKR